MATTTYRVGLPATGEQRACWRARWSCRPCAIVTTTTLLDAPSTGRCHALRRAASTSSEPGGAGGPVAVRPAAPAVATGPHRHARAAAASRRRPASRRGRPRGPASRRAATVWRCSSKGRGCGDDHGRAPGGRDLGDGVLAGVGDHHVGAAQLRPQGRGPGGAGRAALDPRPLRGGAPAAGDAGRAVVARRRRPTSSDAAPAARCGARDGVRAAVEAGDRADEPRLVAPRVAASASRARALRARAPAARPPGRRRAGARRRSGRPACATTTTGTPHSRASSATSTETSTTTSAGPCVATHAAICADPSGRPGWCRGAQCSAPRGGRVARGAGGLVVAGELHPVAGASRRARAAS